MNLNSNNIEILKKFFSLDFNEFCEDGNKVRYEFLFDLNDDFFNSFEISFLITFEDDTVKMEFELGELYKIIVVPNDFKFDIHAINYLKHCLKEANKVYHDNDKFLQYITNTNSKNLYTIKLIDGLEILVQYIGKSRNQENISLYQCINGDVYTVDVNDDSYYTSSHKL